MSQANVEVILDLVEATNRQDGDAFVARCGPEVEWEDSLFPGLAGIHRGRTELREWFRQAVVEPWDRIHCEVEEAVEVAGDVVLLELLITTRGKGSGVETELRLWQTLWMADGEIAKRRVFHERADAVEAAGLAE
jgi:ketosteroid isomerase-like protein